MPYSIREFQTTPNPNALKCILDKPLSPAPHTAETIRSFRAPHEAAGDPLGEALFAIPGVSSVLLSGDWLTVNKTSDALWPGIKKGVQDVLRKA